MKIKTTKIYVYIGRIKLASVQRLETTQTMALKWQISKLASS